MKRSDFRLLSDGSIAEQFLHGVDLDNATLVHNLSIDDRLWTANCMGIADPGIAKTYRPIGEISIEELRFFGPYGNVLSPRSAKYLIPAAILDSGQTIVNGYGEPQEVSARRIIDTRDIELAFEKGRRHYAPQAPSRLSCIWLAESSSTGHSVIRSMLPDAYVANVRVQFCMAFTVADAGWFDEYFNFAKLEYIENYWTGKAHPTYSCPEILVDGVVQFVEPAQLEHIRKYGAKFTGHREGQA